MRTVSDPNDLGFLWDLGRTLTKKCIFSKSDDARSADKDVTEQRVRKSLSFFPATSSSLSPTVTSSSWPPSLDYCIVWLFPNLFLPQCQRPLLPQKVLLQSRFLLLLLLLLQYCLQNNSGARICTTKNKVRTSQKTTE